ncbi:hypothetical protein HQ576_10285 [bacterium]|nr:hypothetical protein [bacterium]
MAVSPPRLTLGQRARLWWGKARRYYLGRLRPGYVKRQHERRRGECARCGACCQLGIYCWSLQNHQPVAECKRHTSRPMNCRIFPIDERDLRDRDLIVSDVRCGYSFDDDTPSPPSTEP